ncbi:MAG: MlaD family protein [Gemmatimonadota bacterium]
MPRHDEPAWDDLKLGMSVTAIALAAVVAVFLIGSTRGPFGPDSVPYYVDLAAAGGVRVGSLVRVAGLSAGEVTDLVIVPPQERPRTVVGGRLQPATGLPPPPPNIRLQVSVHERFQPYITAASRAQLATLGLGGERYVRLTAGDVRQPPLAAGATIEEIPSVDWDLLVAELNRAFSEIEVLSVNIQEIRTKLFEGDATAGRLLDPESPIYASLDELADQSEGLLDDLDQGTGIIPGYRREAPFVHSIERIRADLRAIDSLADGGLGAWEEPVDLNRALADLEAEAEDLRVRLREGRGTLGRLLYDEELWIQLRVLEQRTRETVEAFREDPLGFVNIRLF